MEAYIIPLITIALAELFDKSQLAILLLATQTKKHLHLFLGVLLAFALLTGAAIVAGDFLTSIVPESILTFVSSGLFLFFGIKAFLSADDEKPAQTTLANSFLTGFMMIFFAELGDKTQLSVILFATRFHPFFVFLGAMTALSLLSLAAIKLGGVFAHSTKKKTLTKIAGALFIIIGITFLVL